MTTAPTTAPTPVPTRRARLVRAVVVVGAALAGVALLGFGVMRFAANRTNHMRQFEARWEAAAVLEHCGSTTGPARNDCFQEALTARLDSSGVARSAALLSAIAAQDSQVAQDAHVLAHGLGIEAFTRSSNVAATFDACGDAFSSGCRHGVIQAYFEARSEVDKTEVEGLCEPFRGIGGNRWLLFQCVHGMGHGLTMFYGRDVPKALVGCDLLSSGWDRESCYGGVFMENIIGATAPHHPATRLSAHSHHHSPAASTFRPLDPKDPLYPCSIMAARYLNACYLMQTSAMLYQNSGDIAGAARSCDRAPVRMRSVCYQSLGRDISAYARRDPTEATRMCGLGNATHRPACYVGVVKALVDWTATTDSGFAFCGRLGDEPSMTTCYHALGEEIAGLVWSPPARAQECARATQTWAVNACREGAGLRRG